jgi:hypothetical protein
MHCLIAFICRTFLLSIYVVLGRYENQAVPLDIVERAVITCMQVCILGAAWAAYEVCAFVIRVISRQHLYSPVLLLPSTEGEQLTEMQTGKSTDEPHGAEPAAVEPLQPAAASPSDVKPSTDAGRITFESSLALGQYIAKVHVIGVVVWTTMLSIDYSLSQTSFAFVLGMLLGNVAAVLTGRAGKARMSLAVLAVYWGLTCALVLLYLVQDGASALSEAETQLGMTPSRVEWSQLFTVMNVLLSPASCGFSWTYWMDARTLLAHYHTSLYTCVILSVPVLIFVQGNFLMHVLQRYSPLWLAHIIVTEPLLKFMTIYVMTLSLEPESVAEMLAVYTTVLGVCYLSFEAHEYSFNVTVGVLIACLFLLHAARVARRALAEHRASHAAKFVIVDEP